jgi:hypothetical protein
MATPSRARQVIVRAPAARVRDLFRRLASLPRGTRVRPLLVRVGLATLQVIHEAFLVKAGGRADDAGVRWQALSPVTVRLSPRRRQPVEILRDRDALEESLNPADPEAGWTRAPRRRYQVFRLQGRAVTVGTRRPWAWTHHRGLFGPRMRLPQRRLWPALHRWPPRWWQQILRHGRAAMIDLVLAFLKGTP